MKRLLPTLILVFVCIGGFWYASSHSFFQDKTADAVKTLVAQKAADIQAIQLQVRDTSDPLSSADLLKQTELKKTTEWQMLQPSALPVNPFTVDSWNEAFVGLTYENVVDENPTNLADYGLAESKRYFQVTFKDGSIKKLIIGNALPIAGHVYAKFADAPKVYDITEQALQSLEKQPFDFVDKNAVKFKYDNVKSIQIEWKGAKWLLEKAQADKTVFESTWKLDGKELKSNEGTAIIDKIVALSTDQMPKASAEVKMDSPELKISVIETNAGKENRLTFNGKIVNDKVWIAKQDDAWAFAVTTSSVQEAFNASKPAQATPKASPAP
jgi:hypothetical protein